MLEASLLGVRTMKLSKAIHSPEETKSSWIYSLKMIFKKCKQKPLGFLSGFLKRV